MLFSLIKKTILHNKVLVIFMILSTLLTSTIGCFVYGVYQNYSEKLKQGDEIEKIIDISATGSVGIKTKHRKYVKQAEENNLDFSAEYSVISKKEKYVEINNEKYRIIGETNNINFAQPICIPFTALPDDTPLAGLGNTASIFFKRSITVRDFNEVNNIFETNLNGKAVVNNMDLSELSDKSYYKTMLLISAVITILFSINLAMIYKFVVESNRRCVAIFRLCRCSKRKSVFLFLCQALILTVPFFIISQIIFDKILYIKLLNVFPLMEDSFSINVYAIMFFTYLLVSAGILYVLIRKRIGHKINFKEDLR